jgi:uncharacterized protein (UPF0371 family)
MLIMRRAGLTVSERAVVSAALERELKTHEPAAAIQLQNGVIITGKTTPLLGASAALILNALKAMGGIPKSQRLMSPSVIEPIQDLKVTHLGNRNPRLHTDEALLALSICAVSGEYAELAMQQLEKLKGCEAHSTVLLSQVDESTFRKLGVNLTCEPKYQTKNLYHK